MEPETPVFSLSLCALTNCSVQAESVWLIVIYKRDLEENWKWELVSIISQIEYIFFINTKGHYCGSLTILTPRVFAGMLMPETKRAGNGEWRMKG